MKRIFAFIIDVILFIPFYFILIEPTESFFESIANLSEENQFKTSVNLLIVIYFFVIEILFKTTLGKFIFSIRMSNQTQKYPIRFLIIGRLFLKYFSILTIVGAFINLFNYLQRGSVWYDEILGLKLIVKKE